MTRFPAKVGGPFEEHHEHEKLNPRFSKRQTLSPIRPGAVVSALRPRRSSIGSAASRGVAQFALLSDAQQRQAIVRLFTSGLSIQSIAGLVGKLCFDVQQIIDDAQAQLPVNQS